MSTDMLASSNKPDRPIKDLDNNATVIPVGLDFGPSRIEASYTLQTDRYPCSTSIPSSQVYKDFYSSTLSMAMQQHLDFEEPPLPSPVPMVPSSSLASSLIRAFAQHISDLLVKLVLMKNRLSFKVMAITIPSHWDISALTVVAKAAELAGQALDGQHMVIKLPRAIQSAFKMCRETHGTYHTLVVNYHKSHLHLMIAQMRGTGFIMQREVWLPDLGEDGIRDAGEKAIDDETSNEYSLRAESPNAGSMNQDIPISELIFRHRDRLAVIPKKPITKDPPKQLLTHASSALPPSNPGNADPQDDTNPNLQPILSALHKFIHLLPPSPPSSLPDTPQPISRYLPSDITYIVVCGDATPLGLQTLLTAIAATYAQHADIQLRACLYNCGAIGAEIAARRQWENPMFLGVWEGGEGD